MFRILQLFLVLPLSLIAPELICSQERTPVPQQPAYEIESQEIVGSSGAQSVKHGDDDSPVVLVNQDTPATAANKDGADSSSEESSGRVMDVDLAEDGPEEKLKLRPEIFFQGRFSFQPDRHNEFESGLHLTLTQLEIGWSGRITRRFGASLELQLHSVINGEPRDVINDAFVEYYLCDHSTIRGGQITKPFGFDAQQSSSVRESPERAMFVGYFFPGEHDRGVTITGNLDSFSPRAFKGVTYSFGLFRGNVFLSDAQPQFNYVARLRKVFDQARFAVGISIERGKQPLPEGLAGKSKKNILGADFQYVLGRFKLRGEFVAGHTPSLLVQSESIPSFHAGAHSAGGDLFAAYRLTRKSSVYARYDQFNGDPAVGKSIRAFNFGYFRQVGNVSRLSFDYQVKNRPSFNEDAVNDKFQITWSSIF